MRGTAVGIGIREGVLGGRRHKPGRGSRSRALCASVWGVSQADTASSPHVNGRTFTMSAADRRRTLHCGRRVSGPKILDQLSGVLLLQIVVLHGLVPARRQRGNCTIARSPTRVPAVGFRGSCCSRPGPRGACTLGAGGLARMQSRHPARDVLAKLDGNDLATPEELLAPLRTKSPG